MSPRRALAVPLAAGLLLGLPLAACRPVASASAGMIEVGAARGFVEAVYSGSPEKGHIRDTVGQGACWLDVGRDGDLDLFVPNGARALTGKPEPWRLWVNEGGTFQERAAALGAAGSAWGVGCAVGDVDANGAEDLIVTTTTHGARLLLQRGGRFDEVTREAGLERADFTTAAVLSDLDLDGDLDLFLSRYLDESAPPEGACRWKGEPVTCGPKGFPPLVARLFWNDGRGRFREAAESAGIALHRGFGLGALALDADEDGDPDLAVANDSSPNHLFLNQRDGTFLEAALEAGIALSSSGAPQAGMGIEAADLDGDGGQDLVITNFSDDVHNFYRREGPALFTDWSARSGLAAASFSRLGWSALAEDFDLDGDLDLFFANGHVYPGVERFDANTSYFQPPQLLFNDGAGRFREETQRLGEAFNRPIAARGAAAADLDSDGDADLAVVRDGAPPLLFENHLLAPGAKWIKLRLAARAPGNREGIGARVELRAAGRTQVREVRRGRGYLSSGPAELLLGLGPAGEAEHLTVHWPGGERNDTCTRLAAGRVWTVVEGEGCR